MKESTEYVHFSNTARANIEILFQVQEFNIINDIAKEPLDKSLWQNSPLHYILPSLGLVYNDEMVLMGVPVKGKWGCQTHTWALQLEKMHFAPAHEEDWSPPAY